MIKEVEKKVIDRIKLLYDPMFAIVGVASLVPELTTTSISDDIPARAIMLRSLRMYPQILNLYVGFDSGDFLMVTRIAEPDTAMRQKLQAPKDAAFAIEVIGRDAAGERQARWLFLAEDEKAIGSRDAEKATFDPRERPWYRPAKDSQAVEHVDLYLFASSGEPGFTVSRAFQGPTPGVMGADLAALDLSTFLAEQNITPGSAAFIFTKSGHVIAMSDPAPIAKAVSASREATAAPPKVGEVQDPVIRGLIAAYERNKRTGAMVYDVDGRRYIGRIAEIPPRYGQDQMLAIMAPIDEIHQPIIEIRNRTLLYSIAFLVFALPLYATLIVAWIDRRLQPPAR
jgi:adenylate cyclase